MYIYRERETLRDMYVTPYLGGFAGGGGGGESGSQGGGAVGRSLLMKCGKEVSLSSRCPLSAIPPSCTKWSK